MTAKAEFVQHWKRLQAFLALFLTINLGVFYASRLASVPLGSVHAGLASTPMALAMLELSPAFDEGRRCAHRVARPSMVQVEYRSSQDLWRRAVVAAGMGGKQTVVH